MKDWVVNHPSDAAFFINRELLTNHLPIVLTMTLIEATGAQKVATAATERSQRKESERLRAQSKIRKLQILSVSMHKERILALNI
jgi:hypothetical protein